MVLILGLTDNASIREELKADFCVEMYKYAQTLKKLPREVSQDFVSKPKPRFQPNSPAGGDSYSGNDDLSDLGKWEESERLESLKKN